MNVLITGGGGFLGSFICDVHIERGDSVVALDLSDGAKVAHLATHPNFRFLSTTVTDEATMREEIRASDLVYHLAAVADPRRYVEDPLHTLQLDLIAGLHVVDWVVEAKRPLVFTSTSEVYGRNPQVPWTEDADRVLGSTAINRWSYATAKAALEHYILAHHQQSGLEFNIFRPFNFFGPRLDSLGAGRVVTIFLEKFLAGQPVQIHGDGTQTRTFCFIRDAAEGIVLGSTSEKARNTVLNIGTDIEHTIESLAETMRRVGGFSSPIEYITYESAFGTSYEDIPRRIPDLSRIRSLTGWEATTSLEDGLAQTIEYFHDQQSTAG